MSFPDTRFGIGVYYYVTVVASKPLQNITITFWQEQEV